MGHHVPGAVHVLGPQGLHDSGLLRRTAYVGVPPGPGTGVSTLHHPADGGVGPDAGNCTGPWGSFDLAMPGEASPRPHLLRRRMGRRTVVRSGATSDRPSPRPIRGLSRRGDGAELRVWPRARSVASRRAPARYPNQRRSAAKPTAALDDRAIGPVDPLDRPARRQTPNPSPANAGQAASP